MREAQLNYRHENNTRFVHLYQLDRTTQNIRSSAQDGHDQTRRC